MSEPTLLEYSFCHLLDSTPVQISLMAGGHPSKPDMVIVNGQVYVPGVIVERPAPDQT